MKLVWENSCGYPIATVEHLLADDIGAAWPNLVKQLNSKLRLDPEQDILFKLVQGFGVGVDVRSAKLDGNKIKARAMCPASAWLFIRQFENLLTVIVKQPSILQGAIIDKLKSFGFDMDVSRPKENGFLQPARTAAFDIIRSSTTYPKYVIRNHLGIKVSVLQQFTDRTSHFGTQISTNKLLAAEVLSLAALPTPRTFSVFSADHAIKLFKQQGFRRAVLKPCSTDRGLGVHTALETDKDLSIAFKAASEHGKVILQEHVTGDDFRILVVDGAVIGVTQRKPFAIVGNGQMSIQDLIIEKLKWRANHPFYRNFNKFSPDSQDIKFTLQKQGLSFDDVLSEGRTLVLRSNANVSSGGEHLDVTEKCHDDVKHLALDCAELFGLDVAGIDYLSQNITASWINGNGVVCEVNPTPAMSVDGMPEKVFERLNGLARPLALNQDVGDVLYIKDCACKSIADIKNKFSNFNFIDLRKINEKQYFFQSFLTARSGRYFCIINTQMLDRYGLVNSNVREIILCANCASQSGSLQNLPNTPYDFNITYL
jgi:glutathione synthase/RimK-type ligase-like ATP-grasp enzyme